MTPSPPAGAGPVTSTGPTTLVLVCDDLSVGLDLGSLTRRLEVGVGVAVETIADLCGHPSEVGCVAAADATRLVLAVCRPLDGDIEWQRRMRERGIDPLAVSVVPFGSTDAAGRKSESTIATATLRIRAGIARALASDGASAADGAGPVVPRLATFAQRISRRGLLTVPPIRYQPVATLDAGRCAAASGCRICADSCPLGALSVTPGTAVIDRGRCEACGLCAAECPVDAIDVPGHTREQLAAEIITLLTADPGAPIPPRALLFRGRCADSTSGEGAAGAWLPVDVPCAGALTAALLLGSLALGASAVAAVGCGTGCRFNGHERIENTVRYCRALLDTLGIPSDRVRLLDARTALPEELIPGGADTFPPEPPHEPDERSELLSSAAPAILALAAAAGVAAAEPLTHPHSPLGLVDVDRAACTACGACAWACPTGALTFDGDGGDIALHFDPAQCPGCGLCTPHCPEFARDAITVRATVDLGALRAGRQTLISDRASLCERCGEPVGPSALLARLEEQLRDSANPAVIAAITRRCVACRGFGAPVSRPPA
ncbi:MAG: 4Fe-4S binding protein [Dehalococcoidia bacterium]